MQDPDDAPGQRCETAQREQCGRYPVWFRSTRDQRQAERGKEKGRFADAEMAQVADAYGDFLAERFDDEVAVMVTQAPAYPYLVSQLDELDRNGSDGKAMLAAAVEERTLQGVDDPAAVLSWRLERMWAGPAQEQDLTAEPEWELPDYEVPEWTWGDETYVRPAESDQRRVLTEDYELAVPDHAERGRSEPGYEHEL